MMRASPVLLGFVVGLVLAACGKDTGIDSGLPPEKQGSMLTPSEQGTLCEAAADYLDTRIDASDWIAFNCTGDALGEASEAATDTAGRIAACKMFRDQCIATATPEEDPMFECSSSDQWTMCNATVAQIETCLEDAADLLDGLLRDFTCEILDPARAEALQKKYGNFEDDYFPPSCDVVIANCPAALGEDDAMTPTPAAARVPIAALRAR